MRCIKREKALPIRPAHIAQRACEEELFSALPKKRILSAQKRVLWGFSAVSHQKETWLMSLKPQYFFQESSTAGHTFQAQITLRLAIQLLTGKRNQRNSTFESWAMHFIRHRRDDFFSFVRRSSPRYSIPRKQQMPLLK